MMARKMPSKFGLSAIVGLVAVLFTAVPTASIQPESNSAMACVLDAYEPYASGGKVWYGGYHSGCGIVDAHLRWAKPGGTSIIASRANATSSVMYDKICNWGGPAFTRNAYSGSSDIGWGVMV